MTMTSTSDLSAWFLNDCALSLDNCARQALRPKVGELLYLLLSAQGIPRTRQELATKLWPDADHESATTSLRQLLLQLKKALEPQEYRLDAGVQKVRLDVRHTEVDVFAFRAAMKQGMRSSNPNVLERALNRYAGPLLPASKLSVIVGDRTQLQNLYLKGLEDLAERCIHLHQQERATEFLFRALNTDPTRESVVAFLLRIYSQDRTQATRVFTIYKKALARNSNAPPNARIEAQYNIVLDKRPRRESGKKTAPPAALPRLVRFPAPLYPLIGREKEMDRLQTRLVQTPLVTLTGPGGVGKTRLALEVCRCCADSYRNGVVFVDLSGLPPDSTQERIAETVASALEIKSHAALFLEEVTAFLEVRHMLIVLDNCEHVPVQCLGLVRVLLQKCFRLTILVTSRVELAANYGATVEVKPLRLPPADKKATVEDLADSPAVQLFERIASNRRDDFALTAENAEAIRRICRATDGLPLAITLVASNGSFTWTELAEQLDGGFAAVELPVDPTSPVRTRTVLNSVAWSDERLTAQEHALFCGLSIFVGGWTYEATEALFGSGDPDVPKPTVLLERLRAASLVERREIGERSRFHMLETIREYAHKQLEKSGKHAEIAQRHLEYYLARAEQTAKLRPGNQQNEALKALSLDQENLRAAFNYSIVTGQTVKAMRLASSLSKYWYAQGRGYEGQIWFERILEIGGGAPPELRRDALHSAAAIAYTRDDYERARALWTECLALSLDPYDEPWVLKAQGNLGNCLLDLEDYAGARTLFETVRTGFQRRNDEHSVAQARMNLGRVLSREGNSVEAYALFEASLSTFRAENSAYDIWRALINMAHTLITTGSYTEAHTPLAEAIQIGMEIGNRDVVAHCLTNYVTLAVGETQWERAAFLIGADEALREQIGYPIPMRAQVDYQRSRQQTRAELGEIDFEIHWKAGGKSGLAEVCHFARERNRQLPQ